MNLGEIGENGQLKIVQNVNEIKEIMNIWNEIKEDRMHADSTKENVNEGNVT